jgi:hypothetical protein
MRGWLEGDVGWGLPRRFASRNDKEGGAVTGEGVGLDAEGRYGIG